MTLPDFIGIGAQKAGTSWLARNLAAHPQIWVPPLKELHFFDRPPNWRDPIRRYVDSDADGVPSRGSAWDLRYDRHPRDRAWYEALFEPAPGQVCGEVTPGYAALDDSDVDRVARLLPAARVLFFLRNPIERTWSQTMMYLHRYGLDRDRVGGARLRELFRLPRVVRLSDYPRTLREWSARYPPERIFVGFFDEIASAPRRSFRGPSPSSGSSRRSPRRTPTPASTSARGASSRWPRPPTSPACTARSSTSSTPPSAGTRRSGATAPTGSSTARSIVAAGSCSRSRARRLGRSLAAGGGVEGVRSAPLAASAH